MTARAPVRPLSHDTWREDRPDGTVRLGSRIPLGPVARSTGDWVRRWAADAPRRTFIAQRSGAGWRQLRYAALLQQVEAVAAALLGRGMGADTPLLVLSGAGVDHAVLALAAQYVGVPVLPLAEEESLTPLVHRRLARTVAALRPRMVFADRAGAFASALALPGLVGIEAVCADTAGASGPVTPFARLLRGDHGVDVAAAHAAVGPDTVAKILFTSGATGAPKGVVTTQRMLCVNQAQAAAAMPFLQSRPHRMLDWLPWSHVFGGSHNLNLMLSTGGSYFVDHGRPTPGSFAGTLRNIRERAGTLCCNVPAAYSMLVAAMRGDPALRRAFFADLDVIFHAAAPMEPGTWNELQRLAKAETGRVPLMLAGWGTTETAPAATQAHQRVGRPGNMGVPLPGTVLKLVPRDGDRFEVRVAGPNVSPGYWSRPALTRRAFDAEGFFCTGDAVRFVDAADPDAGLCFAGRLADDFVLADGTQVHATPLRLAVLGAMAGVAADVVLAGAGRDQVGLLLFLDAGALEARGIKPAASGGAMDAPGLRALVAGALRALSGQAGPPLVPVRRALVLAEPPSVMARELTPKGVVNPCRVLARRAAMVRRLFDDDDPAVILADAGVAAAAAAGPPP